MDDGEAARALAGGEKGALGLHAVGRRADAYRALEIERAASGECDERELVRDVLYACQGIDGEFIKFSPAEQAFALAPNVNVSAGRRNLIKCLTEVGWLFKKVSAALGDGRTAGVDGDDGDGSTRQAFRAAIQRELASYYKLIAVLEAQAQIPIVAYLERGDGAAKGGDSYLTLRRLFVWLADPLKMLRTLAVLVDASARQARRRCFGGHVQLLSTRRPVIHRVGTKSFERERDAVFGHGASMDGERRARRPIVRVLRER